MVASIIQTQTVEELGDPKSPLFNPQTALQRACLANSPWSVCISFKQKQVGYIMQEFDDAAQRAERLSAARDNFLTGKSNPPTLVTPEDLTIYTRWLVCHLHSLRTIHHYLQVGRTDRRTTVCWSGPSGGGGTRGPTPSGWGCSLPQALPTKDKKLMGCWSLGKHPHGALHQPGSFRSPSHILIYTATHFVLHWFLRTHSCSS